MNSESNRTQRFEVGAELNERTHFFHPFRKKYRPRVNRHCLLKLFFFSFVRSFFAVFFIQLSRKNPEVTVVTVFTIISN